MITISAVVVPVICGQDLARFNLKIFLAKLHSVYNSILSTKKSLLLSLFRRLVGEAPPSSADGTSPVEGSATSLLAFKFQSFLASW